MSERVLFDFSDNYFFEKEIFNMKKKSGYYKKASGNKWQKYQF